MVNYRRLQIPGGTVFFTVNLKDRRLNYLTKYYDHLQSAFEFVRKEKPFKMKAFVVLPEHMHMIWQLPKNDEDYISHWREVKVNFTRRLLKEGLDLIKDLRGEYNLWQRRYWEHQIRDEVDYERHVNYIHYNPIKHGYVDRVMDWPYSSFRYFVASGVYPADWSSNAEGFSAVSPVNLANARFRTLYCSVTKAATCMAKGESVGANLHGYIVYYRS